MKEPTSGGLRGGGWGSFRPGFWWQIGELLGNLGARLGTGAYLSLAIKVFDAVKKLQNRLSNLNILFRLISSHNDCIESAPKFHPLERLGTSSMRPNWREKHRSETMYWIWSAVKRVRGPA